MKLDWNDLQHFVALARHGSTIAAGKALGVDPSTVQRRVAALERQIGRPLAQRLANGYRLTEFGQQMLAPAEGVAQAVAAFEGLLAAQAREQVGVLRLTCPEPLVQRLAPSAVLQRFHAAHPGWRVEFVISDKYLDLKVGEADVALRSGDTDDGELLGRKIGDSLWAVYGSSSYLQQHGRPGSVQALAQHPLVGLDDSMAGHRAARWLAEVAPDATLAARCSSVLGMLSSVKSGMGLGPLPTALGDAEPELERVLGPIPELQRIWRLLTTPELRHTPRVAAFFDFMVGEVEGLKPILTG